MLVCLLALTGCGASTRSSSSSAPGTSSSATSSGTAGTTAATSSGTAATTPATTATTTTTTTTTTGGHRRGSAPATPGGLRATAGYASYGGCAGTCTGAVPAALRRPLAIPAGGGPCPITLNTPSPVTVPVTAQLGFARVSASTWLAASVTWRVGPSYSGPVLIRGRELGSATPVGFGTGAVPVDELQLLDSGQGIAQPRGGRAWRTVTRVPAAGCYAYQVDGTSFSAVIVFRAVG